MMNFNAVVEEARKRKGLSQKMLGAMLGINQGTYSRSHKGKNRWPKSDQFLAILAAALGIANASTEEQVRNNYVVGRWDDAKLQGYGPRTGDPKKVATDRAKIQLEAEQALEKFAQLADSLNDFEEYYGDGDFLVATTVNKLPLFLSTDLRYAQWRTARLKAISRGLRSILVTPNQTYYKIVRRYSPSSDPNFLSQVKKDFLKFKEELIAFVRKEKQLSEADANKYADYHIAHFDWNEFPLTSLDWTLVLVGRSVHRTEAKMGILFRGPITYGRVCYLEGAEDAVFALRDFAKVVLKDRRKDLERKRLSPAEGGTLDLVKTVLQLMGVAS